MPRLPLALSADRDEVKARWHQNKARHAMKTRTQSELPAATVSLDGRYRS